MIFTRRDIQERLTELRSMVPDVSLDPIIRRLNRPGRDRLAAMWEVVLIHALSRLGRVQLERVLPTGRRPDITFHGEPSFTLDVTTVSDEGLDRDNPYEQLSDQLERLKTRLGLPIGGLDLQIGSRREPIRRGERVKLLLPERSRIADFVRDRIEPELKAQLAGGAKILSVHVLDEKHDVKITIDPSRSPYSSGGHASYNLPSAVDRNPLYSALKAKARQLKGSDGITGIVVGDAGSRSLVDPRFSHSALSLRDIMAEFLRQHSSVDFVLIITVDEDHMASPRMRQVERHLQLNYLARNQFPAPEKLEQLFREMMVSLPKPRRTGVNAAREAAREGYGPGHHGGYQMSGRRLKVSSRAIMELLAGRTTPERFNELHGWSGSGMETGRANRQNPFDRALAEGRLPETVTVELDPSSDDDWIEFILGSPDPAISPFR
jgi:hypothetical protein